MALSNGQQVGPYQILAPVGRGGMGEVYRAHDSRLGRDVAIKVLPEAFANDAERLARFDREARLLATFSHPGVASIYGFEEANGMRFLVLEFVEGDTLADRLQTGSMPIDESLDVARQMAEALETAHDRGVIHRDLKPANIKLTPEGMVKILDFGLAKALTGDKSASELADSPTITAEYTRPGVVMGTASYMSPEQARGRALDKRTDIWSFGCVVYECLTGEKAFEGETSSDVIARILERDPDYDCLPPNTPPVVRQLLQRCLEKDRKRRLRDIGDARLELDETVSTRAWTTGGLPAARGLRGLRRGPMLILVAAALLAGGIALGFWLGAGRSGRPAALALPTCLSIVLPPDIELSGYALSPDGRTLAFVGRESAGSGLIMPTRQIYVRRLDSYAARALPGTDGAVNLRFSPSGQWIAFRAVNDADSTDQAIKRVRLDGTPPVTIRNIATDVLAHYIWLDESMLLVVVDEVRVLARLSLDSGELERIPALLLDDEDLRVGGVQLAPGGGAVLLSMWGVTEASGKNISAVDHLALDTGKRQRLLDDSRLVACLQDQLVITRDDTLMAVPCDPVWGKVTGPPTPLLADVQDAVVSPAGHLVYRPRLGSQEDRQLAVVDAAGRIESLAPIRRAYQAGLAVSPDGQRLAVQIRKDDQLPRLWVFEFGTGLLQPVTPADIVALRPVWSSDSRRLAFWKPDPGDRGIYLSTPGASVPPEEFFRQDPATGEITFATSFTPDGRTLLATRVKRGWQGGDLILLSLEDRSEQVLLATSASERGGWFSPDGRVIAYTSDEGGETQLYVQQYDAQENALGAKRQVSADGASGLPSWSRDGRHLYYQDLRQQWLAVAIETEPALAVSAPKILYDLKPLRTVSTLRPMPDGERFVFVQKSESEQEAAHLHIVLNWTGELREKVRGVGEDK